MSQTTMPEPSPLSPAAQVVWDAFDQDTQEIEAVAAVLRAAANQVGEWESAEKLRAIAAELEGAQ